MNRMMMMSGSNNANEEFSFPIISNNPLSNFMLSSSSASSSSLWRISSRIYHHQEDYEEHYPMEVQSMCEEILPSNDIDENVSFRSKELEVEEIMDYLWEDFDEEDRKEEIQERKSNGGEMGVMKVKKMVGSRGRNSNGGNSRTKMVVIAKMLKRLVSIKKSAQFKLFKVENKAMRQGL
ncbi:unnamed protein product [Amaranthus hypochondriacus]